MTRGTRWSGGGLGVRPGELGGGIEKASRLRGISRQNRREKAESQAVWRLQKPSGIGRGLPRRTHQGSMAIFDEGVPFRVAEATILSRVESDEPGSVRSLNWALVSGPLQPSPQVLPGSSRR